jgi:rare lipoprotein A
LNSFLTVGAPLAILGLLALALGCAATQKATRQTPPASRPAVGLASWYGRAQQAHPTAFAGVYDADGLTAAHRTLPVGTRLQVTNLHNGRRVVVRVTDRGPYVPGRILDLSYGAAKALGMADDGLVPVKVVVLADGG